MGLVRELNSGSKPVVGVVICSEGANNVTLTDSNKFTLTYQSAEIGADVVVQVKKDGWELVNKDAMFTRIPKNPDNKPLKIILSKEGTLAKAKKEYYDIADDQLLREFKKRLAILNRKQKNWRQDSLMAVEQLQKLQSRLDQMADELSRLNLDDASDLEKKAISVFREGKIHESIRIREGLKSIESIEEIERQQSEAEQKIQQHLNNIRQLIKEYIITFDFKNADKQFRFLLQRDSSNFDNNFDYALFLDTQNRINESILYYQKSINSTNLDTNIAKANINLSGQYLRNRNIDNSLKSLQRALSIYQKLSLLYNGIYDDEIGLVLINLSNVYQTKNDNKRAITELLKAISIFEKLATNNKNDFLDVIAAAKTNLAMLYSLKGDADFAVKTLSDSQQIYEELIKQDSAKYSLNLGNIYNTLGYLYDIKKEYVMAVIYYEKALTSIEISANKNSVQYQPIVAKFQNNLGQAYEKTGRTKSGLKAYERAISILESLAAVNPDSFEPDLAECYNNLGNLCMSDRNYEQAEKFLKNALTVNERLALKNKILFINMVALNYDNLSLLYLKMNDTDRAIEAANSAIEIYRSTSSNVSDNLPVVANLLGRLGNLYSKQAEIQSAKKNYEQAVIVFEKLSIKYNKRFDIALCKSVVDLANILKNSQTPTDRVLIRNRLKNANALLEGAPKGSKTTILQKEIKSLFLYYQ
ncbi:hypothetical protein Dfri01_10270 [Dyadobacter frigoris]|uniref:tetratricopeptide repeat protein n=1 Tax=Dyadobacter frigoris TaxID=2576211 RepID=UPI0024A10135|nr:tetratricopeptide repeat protein [Dyadobacter frigoris]GLU51566.1 hypothetical protein Dfri01_10270 [Dyadobacter frigoris]